MLAIYLIGYVICVWAYIQEDLGDCHGELTMRSLLLNLIISAAWPMAFPILIIVGDHVFSTVIYRRKK